MTGNYGDQIILRFESFQALETDAEFVPSRLLPPHVNAGVQAYCAATDTHPLTFAAFRQAPLVSLRTGGTRAHPAHPAHAHTWITTSCVRITGRLSRQLTSNEMRLRLIAEGNPALRRIATDRAQQ